MYYRFATAVHKSPETEEVKISSRVLFSKDHFTSTILSQVQFVIDSELVSESPDPQERLAHFWEIVNFHGEDEEWGVDAVVLGFVQQGDQDATCFSFRVLSRVRGCGLEVKDAVRYNSPRETL